MDFTRKDVIRAGVSAALLAALSGKVQAALAPLDGQVVKRLPSRDAIWAWEEQLGDWAPCFTGNAGHRKFTDWIGSEFEKVGIKAQKKSFGIPLWDPKKWTLSLSGVNVPVASYRPYSGTTGPKGITAKMIYAGTMPYLDQANYKDKIVLVECPAPVSYIEASKGFDLSAHLSHVAVPDLAKLKAAGAVGCVYMWRGVSDDDAQDQTSPFAAPPADLPTLWVNPTSAKILKDAVIRDAELTLTLYAEITPDAKGDNVWGILPGMTDDIVILNTHNDGCNAIEENGPIAVVALAHALAKIPEVRRKKTYIFLTTSGHFAHGYHGGALDWIREHNNYMKKAIACLTMEHLGAMEWQDKDGVYAPTGRYQRADAFAPTVSMAEVFGQAAKDSGFRRYSQTSGKFLFPGEGLLFSAVGIPSIGYIVAPNYLVTSPKGGEVSRLNKDRMYSEIQAFTSCVERLDEMTRQEAYLGMDALRGPIPKDYMMDLQAILSSGVPIVTNGDFSVEQQVRVD